jgi:hypothetical protein
VKQVFMKIRSSHLNHLGGLLAICLLIALAGTWPLHPLTANAQGTTNRAAPSPGDQPVAAGPWTFTISEILTGDQAAAKVAEASGENRAPTDGLQFVAVHLSAANISDQVYDLSEDDFGITGDDNLVRRYDGVTIVPEPALEGSVEPGASIDGWVVAEAGAGEGNLMLIYDSSVIDGNWADAVIALSPGATIADRDGRGEKTNKIGREIGDPAKLNERVVTREWAFTVTDVLEGQDVYNLFPPEDYRTTALGDTDTAGLPYWVGIKVTITNNRAGGEMAYLPPTAFAAVDDGGNQVEEALWLTPPSPDTTGDSYPGGTREGWVLFSMPVGVSLDLVEFLPYSTDEDARYITLGNASQAVDPNITFTAGETVIVTEDEVRMRAEATVDAKIVATLAKGTALEVTGDVVEADGFRWYPVKDPKTGNTGFVVVNYLSYSA